MMDYVKDETKTVSHLDSENNVAIEQGEMIDKKCGVCNQMFSDLVIFKKHQKIHSQIAQHTSCDSNSNRPEEQHLPNVQMSIKNELHSVNKSQYIFEVENILEISKTEYKLEQTVVNAVAKSSQCKQKKIILIDDGNTTLNIQSFQDIKEEFLSDSECLDQMEIESELSITKNINSIVNTSHGFKENSNFKDSLQLHDNTTESLTKSKICICHTGERPFSCSFCKKTFEDKKHLKRHQRVHTDKWIYSCSICKKTFQQPGGLKEHERIHTGERPFSCSICKKSFPRMDTLRNHENIHTGERQYSCSFCKKTFVQRSTLTKHQKTHTIERPFSCSFCEKTFAQRCSLNAHEKNHTGKNLYSCSFCKKTFVQRCSLNVHERIHTGERPYSCSVCKKSFAQRSPLVAHVRIHTGERPYSCSVCKKTFAQRSPLVAHERIHTGERPYSCSFCKKTFAIRNYLTSHERTCKGVAIVSNFK